jgi:hypothetical protein
MATGKTLGELRTASPLRRALVELAQAVSGTEVAQPTRMRRRRHRR